MLLEHFIMIVKDVLFRSTAGRSMLFSVF